MPKIGFWRETHDDDTFEFLCEMPIVEGQREGEFITVLGVTAIVELRDILTDAIEEIRGEVEEVTAVPEKHQAVLVKKEKRSHGVQD